MKRSDVSFQLDRLANSQDSKLKHFVNYSPHGVVEINHDSGLVKKLHDKIDSLKGFRLGLARQWENADEFVRSVIEVVDKGNADWALGEWVSTRQLQGMYKKLTGNTIGEEFLNMVATDSYHFEFRNGAVFVFGVLSHSTN
jgi:hypothetical protein